MIIEGWKAFAQIIVDHISLVSYTFSAYFYLTNSGVKSNTKALVYL
jgi:hypothetical protein